MKNVLILSASTGQGHNSCAAAIQEYFECQGLTCRVEDAFSFISDSFASFMSWGHSFMYRRIPVLFRQGYRLSETRPDAFWDRSPAGRLLDRGSGDLASFIEAGGFDTVICVHSLAAIMLTLTLRRRPLAVRTAFVATDHTVYPGMGMCTLDRYFVADPGQVEAYAACGLDRGRILASGIPVRQAFLDRAETRQARRQLGLEEDSRYLLVMCGSMGCGPMTDILEYAVSLLAPASRMIVVCGTNEKLKKHLDRLYGGSDRVRILGYTRQVALYMAAADLYMTKPGGMSVSEAAAVGMPMVFVDAVAGCEAYNMDHYVKLGGAVTAADAQSLARRAVELLQDPGALAAMRTALRGRQAQDGAAAIFQEMEGLAPIAEDKLVLSGPQVPRLRRVLHVARRGR